MHEVAHHSGFACDELGRPFVHRRNDKLNMYVVFLQCESLYAGQGGVYVERSNGRIYMYGAFLRCVSVNVVEGGIWL